MSSTHVHAARTHVRQLPQLRRRYLNYCLLFSKKQQFSHTTSISNPNRYRGVLMSLETILILMLVAFIVGLMTGISLVRPLR